MSRVQTLKLFMSSISLMIIGLKLHFLTPTATPLVHAIGSYMCIAAVILLFVPFIPKRKGKAVKEKKKTLF